MKNLKKLFSALLVLFTVVLLNSSVVFGAEKLGLSKKSLTVPVGQEITISLLGNTSDLVFWESDNPEIATVEDGVISAKKVGQCKVSAYTGGKGYSCKVTVKDVMLSDSALKLERGATTNVTLYGAKVQSYKSTKPEVASVNNEGLVTALAPGKTVIEVTDVSGKKYKCNVTVNVCLESKKIKLYKGESGDIVLLGAKMVSCVPKKLGVISISSNGHFDAVEVGTTGVTVLDEAGKSYNCTVQVISGFEKKSAKLYSGSNAIFTLKGDEISSIGRRKNGRKCYTSWYQKDNKTVSVTASGTGKSTVTIKGVSGRTYKLTVTAKQGISNKSIELGCGKSASVSLYGYSISSFTNSKSSVANATKTGSNSLFIEAGNIPGTTKVQIKSGRKKFNVKVKVVPTLKNNSMKAYENKSTQVQLIGDNITSATSNNTGIVTVDNNGVITGVKKGTTSIKVKGSNKKVYRCKVTVKDPLKIIIESNVKEVLSGSGSQNLLLTATLNEEVDKVTLYKVNGDEREEIGEMYDDGMYSTNGDELSDDLVYTKKITESSIVADQNIIYEAVATQDNITEKATTEISVMAPFTHDQLDDMQNIENSFDTLVKGFTDSDTEEDRKDDTEEILDSLIASNKIKSGYQYDEQSKVYTFEYKETGVMGGVMIGDFDTDANSADELTNGVDISYIGEAPETVILNADEGNSFVDSIEDIEAFRQNNYNSNLLNNYILESYDDNVGATTADSYKAKGKIFYAFDDATEIYRLPYYESKIPEWNNNGFAVTLDKDVTIQELKEIGNEDIIMFSMHGSTLADGTPVLCTRDTADSYDDAKYTIDLKNKRIITVVTNDDGPVYWIKPDFFKDNYTSSAFDNKVVFSETCCFNGKDGAPKTDIADSLLAVGAEGVIGFRNSVYATYSRNIVFEYCDRLLAGDTLGTALDEGKKKYGATDTEKSPSATHVAAFPILAGDAEFTLVSDKLENGSFEMSSKPVKWTSSGDTRVINKIGSLMPVHGERMGFISTGIGSNESAAKANGTEGSSLSQKVKVPKDASTLSFAYDVISEEPMEFVNTQYDDQFHANLLDIYGNVLEEMAVETVNTAEWFPIDGIDFDGGDHTVYDTKWKNVTVDISKYRGKDVIIEFVTFDKGDSIYDTAAIIDHVRFGF